MRWNLFAAALLSLTLTFPAVAQQPRFSRDNPDSLRTLERWVHQLENELDHLQEELYFGGGAFGDELTEKVEQASRAVAHFHYMLRRDEDRQHLARDFREMDRKIHELVDRLNESGSRSLRRQAQRISYPDEQLHYALRDHFSDRDGHRRDLLARHARVLDSEARNLQQLVDRVNPRDDRLREVMEEFAEAAEDFHEAVRSGEDRDEIRDDFQEADREWHRAIELINRSAYGLYLRRTANNVNRVHNQLDQMLFDRADRDRRPVEPGERVERRRDRTGIEIELPGIGRFEIPL